MAGTFDFCPTSRVIVEMPPEDSGVTSMNGWQFRPKPKTPYRPTFKVTLYGLRWRLGTGVLDTTTEPLKNAGRLLNFYKANRTWDVFALNHEYLGNILVRFNKPLNIPAAEMNSNGLIGPLELELIQHNPAWPT